MKQDVTLQADSPCITNVALVLFTTSARDGYVKVAVRNSGVTSRSGRLGLLLYHSPRLRVAPVKLSCLYIFRQ